MSRRARHWSEVMACSCGARFTDITKESCHRHNFPALCRKKRTRATKPATPKSGHDRADAMTEKE